MDLGKTDNISKTVEAELQAGCQLSLSESAKKGKVDTEETQEEVNTVQKMKECDYDEIKVIQENIVTVNEKVETRF